MEVFRAEQNTELHRRLERLNTAKAAVENIKDKLGLPIDQNVKETIAILNAMDFLTSSSCGGHTGEDGKFAFPYVEFYLPAPDGWKENRQVRELWQKKNTEQKERLSLFLTKYIELNKTKRSNNLYFERLGVLGGFRLQGLVDDDELKTENLLIEKITSIQAEMNDFTEFLKSEFLNF